MVPDGGSRRGKEAPFGDEATPPEAEIVSDEDILDGGDEELLDADDADIESLDDLGEETTGEVEAQETSKPPVGSDDAEEMSTGRIRPPREEDLAGRPMPETVRADPFEETTAPRDDQPKRRRRRPRRSVEEDQEQAVETRPPADLGADDPSPSVPDESQSTGSWNAAPAPEAPAEEPWDGVAEETLERDSDPWQEPPADKVEPEEGVVDAEGVVDPVWSQPSAQSPVVADAGPTRVEAFSPPPEQLAEKTLIFGQGDTPEHPEVPYLVIVQGEEEGREFDLVREEITIGRGPENDLVFPDIAASRRHAMVEQRADGFYLTDLGSGNGTLLNGRRVQTARLQDGDEIEIGSTVLQFFDPSSAPPPDSTATQGRTGVGSTTVTGAPVLTQAGGASAGPLTRLLADPKRRKLVRIGGIALGGLFLLLLIIKLIVPKGPQPLTKEELARQEALQEQREFEQHLDAAKTLVRDKKWREALVEAQVASSVRPDSSIIKDYLVTINRELAAASALELARSSIEHKDWENAMAAITRVGPESEYRPQAESLKREIDEKLIADLLLQGEELMRADQYNQALLKFDDVLKRQPGDEKASELKRRAEAEIEKSERTRRRAETRAGARRIKKPKVERQSTGATGQVLALFRNGEIDKAVDKAESAGNSELVKQLQKFRSSYRKGMELSSNTGQSEKARTALKQALAIDNKISGGNGKYNDEIQAKLSKVCFVAGVDAQTRQKFPEAYKAYSEALKYQGNHELVRARLKDLEKTAKKFYEEAYIIKSTNADQSIKKLKIVVQIVPPDHVYYTKAKKLLASIQGPVGGDDSGGDSGF